MDLSIFRYILRHSKAAQLTILAMTAVSFPFLYASLDLPKTIINEALANDEGGVIFGFEFDQISYLFTLCGIFLVLVLINGGFKYVINVYKGIVGERMLRRLRYELYSRIMRFPLPHFRRISQGELVQMITAEVEPLGGFIAQAFALPAFQGGTLLTILAFMFAQDPVLGLAAIVLYPLQIWVIPKLQRQVNLLGKARVRQVRRLAERVGETAQGVRDIRANDATQYERARFGKELGVVFDIRFNIYKKKFFIKFLNNFLAQLAPFFFYSIGGYLVIQGDLTLGALVAVIGAHEKLYAPWKELLSYYQLMSDARIKYEQVVLQFDPSGVRDEALQAADPGDPITVDGARLQAVNLATATDDGAATLDGASFSVELPKRIAIVGPTGAGKEDLSLILANLLTPDAGRVLLGEHEIGKLPESVTGRQITYVGYPAQIFSGTIADNLLFGLKNRPLRAVSLDGVDADAHKRDLLEAERAGHAAFDADADWIDFKTVGIDPEDDLLPAAEAALVKVQLDRDVYHMGLRGTVDPGEQPDVADAILKARRSMGERLEDPKLSRLVEVFDPQHYNTNATLAENLLFGAPIGDRLQIEQLAAQPYVQEVLKESGLTETLVDVGYRLAKTMVELFQDLPPDHDYFRQFSFIGSEDLPDYRALTSRVESGNLASLSDDEQARLLALTFKLIPARHRLDLVDEALQSRIVEARHHFREHLPEELRPCVAFFDPDSYNTGASIQDNILFGKVAYGQAQANERIGDLIGQVLADLELRGQVIDVGLQAEVGVSGSRLSLQQRQKLALARALLKQPDILILHDAVSPLDPSEQVVVIDALLEAFEGRTLICSLNRSDLAARFDHVLVMRRGQIVEQGAYDDLNHDGSVLHAMVAAE
ncbi:MAG: ABC transporter transmembrane domain-containing protein [Alphaproteobacteria bacterium]|nr:ABC transporter transmembrane domain-containing protein [Alphaproteobacteria bacterium]